MKDNSTFFATMIYLNQVAPAIEFYKNAFDSVVLRQWNNDDDSVHVAEKYINEPLFRMHEESTRNKELSPETLKGTSVAIGLLAKAVLAGDTEIDPVQDYDYHYRQGTLADPFGHHWVLQKKIGK